MTNTVTHVIRSETHTHIEYIKVCDTHVTYLNTHGHTQHLPRCTTREDTDTHITNSHISHEVTQPLHSHRHLLHTKDT